MSMNKGLRMFREARTNTVHKETKQLHDCKVSIPVDTSELSCGNRQEALKYLIFINIKRYRSMNSQGCADGSNQRLHTIKEESIPTTVAIESLMISCVIYDKEERKVATHDISVAFMQSDMAKLVHVKFEEFMAEILIKIDSDQYVKYTCTDRGKIVIYSALSKALYGNLCALLLFWSKLRGRLML